MIYLVEDDDNIRKLVNYALTKEGYEVMDFSSAPDFHAAMSKKLPELVMLDIMLPGEDGLSILSGIKQNKTTSDIPVIMLTAKGSEFDKVTGLDMGADDYIAKPFGITELMARVRAVLRRCIKQPKDNSTVFILGNQLYVDTEKHIIRVDGSNVELSYKEYALLTYLLRANGAVVDRDILLRNIWGEYYGESRTLDVHVRNLRSKLGNCGSYIKTIRGIGYKIEVNNE